MTLLLAALATILVARAGAAPPQSATNSLPGEELIQQAQRAQLRSRPGEARELLLLAWQKAAELGENDPRRATLALFVGSVYFDLGDMPEALPLLEDARRIWEKLGIEAPPYLRTLTYLGGALSVLHRSGEAQHIMEYAVQTGRRTLGEKNEAVGNLLNVVGKIYLEQGKAVEARLALTESAEILRSMGSQPGLLADTLRGLANVNILQGRTAAAGELFRESEEISRPLGEDSLYYAIALGELGNFLLLTERDHARAQPLLKKALVIYESCTGPEDPALIPVLSGLGLVASREGKFMFARQILERARRLASKYGEKRSSQIEFLIGAVLLAEGKTAEALTMLEHVNEVFRSTFGEVHRLVADSFLALGTVNAVLGRRGEADAAYRQSIAIYEQSLGNGHRAVAETLMDYAIFLRKSDKAQARILEQRSKSILSKLHP